MIVAPGNQDGGMSRGLVREIMAYKTEYDAESNITRLSLSGRIDLDHLVEALMSMLEIPEFNWRVLLVYEQDADLVLTGEDMRKLNEIIAERRPADAPFGRTALVAPNDLIYGLTRMHQVYNEGIPSDPQVFRDVDEALEWLLQI